jgi:single-strand DNA-binding protein
MAYENLVILIGNLGANPEVRYMPDGTPTATMRLATTKRYKDKKGDKQEHTEWHRVVGYGQIAKFSGEYAEKGDQVYARGELRTRKWTDKDGQERYTTEIVCRYFQLLSGKRQGEAAEVPAEEMPPADAEAPVAEGADA